ncbi:glycosyltransferase [Rhodococcoides yunnanense]|uniref:glycosyltransferase n=1 Tax=Rhodococcoides yunnanense TaxID=278209 RepID=UPI00093416F3|nr:glycosyltransferase [Rhodococcus yunnanensis]
MAKKHMHYLVGGFRISVRDGSNTPGPRNHILSFIEGARQEGHLVRRFLVSEFPLMARFSKVSQSDYQGSSAIRVWIADIVRIAAAIWCGGNVFLRTLCSGSPDIIYERVAVLQSLSSFHARKRRAFRVVEANGILARETALDRKVLKSIRLATWLEQRVLRRADLVVAVSDALKTELIEYSGLHPSAILVVPNGVSSKLGAIKRSSSDGVTIGFAGSVVAWHHLDELFDAVKWVNLERVGSGLQPIRLEVVGDGPELGALKAKVVSDELSGVVTMLGKLDQASTYERMATWNFGFAGHRKSSSSAMYHSPLKLYEYAALGLGILCTDSSDASSLKECGVEMRIHAGGASVREQLSSLIQAPRQSESNISAIRKSVVKEHSWEARVATVIGRAAVSGYKE